MSILEKNQSIMNPAQQYKITNILPSEFTTYWNGNPITLKAGQTVTVPEYLANKMANEIIDKIMLDELKAKENAYYAANPNTAPNFYRAPNSLAVPAARKVWEDKIVEKLPLEEGSTEAQLLRMQIKESLQHDLNAEPSTEPVKVPGNVIPTGGLDNNRESLAGNIIGEDAPEFADVRAKIKRK